MPKVAAKKLKKAVSAANVINDPAQSLQTFDLLELQQYTQEKVYATTASKDFHLFYVSRDDVHSILKYVLSRVSVSLYLNMFGYDDDELNDILMTLALDPTVTMLVTLDKSQATGKHERALLDLDKKKDLALFNTHVAIHSGERPYASSRLVNRPRTKLAIQRASWQMARWRPRDRQTGRLRERVNLSPERPVVRVIRRKTIPSPS